MGYRLRARAFEGDGHVEVGVFRLVGTVVFKVIEAALQGVIGFGNFAGEPVGLLRSEVRRDSHTRCSRIVVLTQAGVATGRSGTEGTQKAYPPTESLIVQTVRMPAF